MVGDGVIRADEREARAPGSQCASRHGLVEVYAGSMLVT
jgi:hypothetical protein